MAKDNSSDEHEEEYKNSSDEHEEEHKNSSDEHEEEIETSLDEHEEESEKDDSSDDKSKESNPKTGTIKKRKAAVLKKRGKKRKKPEDNSSDEDEEEYKNSSDHEDEEEYESEQENSSDDESEQENSSDDEKSEQESLMILSQRLKEISEEDKDKQSKFQPPDRIIHGVKGLALYSDFIYKQLLASDVNGRHCRLKLGLKEVKDEFFSRLEQSEIPGAKGVNVLVYGRDGKSYEMKFKKRTKKSPVLMDGWSQFVKDYELQKYSDFVKIWMFRGSDEDRKICFAIDSIRVDGITKQLSKDILKKAFKG